MKWQFTHSLCDPFQNINYINASDRDVKVISVYEHHRLHQ